MTWKHYEGQGFLVYSPYNMWMWLAKTDNIGKPIRVISLFSNETLWSTPHSLISRSSLVGGGRDLQNQGGECKEQHVLVGPHPSPSRECHLSSTDRSNYKVQCWQCHRNNHCWYVGTWNGQVTLVSVQGQLYNEFVDDDSLWAPTKLHEKYKDFFFAKEHHFQVCTYLWLARGNNETQPLENIIIY